MSDFQKKARSLVKHATDMGVKISYQQGLELISKINGFKSWAAVKAKEELEKKKEMEEKQDPFSYYCLNYFAHVKDSGSYYVVVNKKEFKKFCESKKDEWKSYCYLEDDMIVEFAIHTGQMDKDDQGYITEVEEYQKDWMPSGVIESFFNKK